MKYILLLAIHWGYGTAMIAPEFDSKAACEAALSSWNATSGWSGPSQVVICVPKG